jgi:hypothetical protein
MECLAFNQDTGAYNGIDSARHGKEFGSVGEFVCTWNFLDEDIFFGNFAFFDSGLLFNCFVVCGMVDDLIIII